MYELNSRVRYSETDIDAKLSLTGIMNYMQDCSTMQSEDAGVGIGYLGREKKAWLLSSWQIVIERRPVLGERIKVVTWPYAVKGLYALRNFAILDENGGYLVKANSYWFLMNTETGRPMRILESDTAPYGEFSPKIEMEDAGRKIAVPKEMEETGRLVVMKHLLDTNLHVNNAQYVDIARERRSARSGRSTGKRLCLGMRWLLKAQGREDLISCRFVIPTVMCSRMSS